MTNINKIPLIFLFIIILSCISAVNAQNPQQATNNPSSIVTIPVDPTVFYSSTFDLGTSEPTAHVGDKVQILVTITNTGLVDWCPVSVYLPVPNGTKFISFTVPDRNLQNYDPATAVWNMYRMRHIERGQQKTAILTVEVLPDAAGKTLNIITKFNQLVLEGYGIDMAKQVSARSTSLYVMNGGNCSYNGTSGPGAATGFSNPWANTSSGIYNKNLLVKLQVNGKETIYYTTNGKTPNNMSQKYIKPINIGSSTMLKFIAMDQFSHKSSVYTKNYIIDKIPPKIVKTTPKNNQVGFSLSAPLTLTFNEKISKCSQYNNIQIKNKNTGKSVTITKSVSGNKLTLKMARSRLSLNNYQIYIPKGALKDAAGNKNSKYIVTFKTGKY
ncbi:MAG: Ig-like domain-containing protein [Methanobacterium sp. ERen5]|nr:MAG: Ig-like domain-containing protein [Methanobacterium sp. ERen5]